MTTAVSPSAYPASIEHVTALAEIKAKSDRVRYAVEHRPDLSVPDLLVWLTAQGANPSPADDQPINRTYAAGIVKSYREGRKVTDTGDLPVLTDEMLAEIDAATADNISSPVQTATIPVQTGSGDTESDPGTFRLPTRLPLSDDELQAEVAAERERIIAAHVAASAAVPVASPAPAVETVSADETAPAEQPLTGAARFGAGVVLTVAAVLLTAVIVAPIALSSQDIIDWAGSSTGLGLARPWDLVTFFALDAAAAVCVCFALYSAAWRGESAGIFGVLVWAFAGTSAMANYRHGTADGAAPDAWWFFPAMSLAGPFLLEMTIRKIRKWFKQKAGQRSISGVSFGFARWVPGVGALRETYGAWRLARLDGITNADQAVNAYRALCPDGSIRVLKALRARAR